MFMCLFAPPFVYISMYTSLYYNTVGKILRLGDEKKLRLRRDDCDIDKNYPRNFMKAE